MIVLDSPGVVCTEQKYLGCPTCREPVKREGFGFVSCETCNSIMLWETAIEIKIKVV